MNIGQLCKAPENAFHKKYKNLFVLKLCLLKINNKKKYPNLCQSTESCDNQKEKKKPESSESLVNVV